jgi:DNA-binding NtrC family response regulator
MSRGKVPVPVVLVIDDEVLIRWSLSESLIESGYPVQAAANGAEARLALEACTGQPLVVLLDLRLPDVRDLSLLHEIRAVRPDAPVIILTAHGTAEDAAAALSAGVFRFVHKPFDVPEIVRLVGEAWTSRAT